MSEDSKEQIENAILRERFLRMLNSMENKSIQIQMHQGANVNAKFRSIDYDIVSMHVFDLHTPIGIVPEALLRINDIAKIEFDF